MESCIGIGKQALKSRGLLIPSDPRETFSRLSALGVQEVALDWRRIIGLRNVLVHDYLNIDPDALLDVYRSSRWRKLLGFARL